jgi:hypothetical protein
LLWSFPIHSHIIVHSDILVHEYKACKWSTKFSCKRRRAWNRMSHLDPH